MSEKLVNLFLIGARKAGTTSLATALSMHPEISLAKGKEPFYFCDTGLSSLKSYKEYRAKFDWSKKLRCDASTSYSLRHLNGSKVVERIYGYNPEAKILYIVRDPFERIVSHYVMAYNRRYTNKSFYDAVVREDHIVNTSKYYFQIEPYIATFGENNVQILFLEDFKRDQKAFLDELSQFLNIGSFEIVEKIHLNDGFKHRIYPRYMDYLFTNRLYLKAKSIAPTGLFEKAKKAFIRLIGISDRPKISEEMERIIFEKIKNDIKSFSSLLNKNLDHWTR